PGRIVEEVRNDLSQAHRVGPDPHGADGKRRREELMPPQVDDRSAGLDRLRDDRAQVDGFQLQRDLPTRDPRNVEQVVHQPRQLTELATDYVPGPENGVVRARDLVQELDRHADRCERVPELVSEHREEFVLAASGLPELLLRQLARRDVHGTPEVAAEGSGDAEIGHPVVQHPTIFAIMTTESELAREGPALRECVIEAVQELLQVIDVNRAGPAELQLVI